MALRSACVVQEYGPLNAICCAVDASIKYAKQHALDANEALFKHACIQLSKAFQLVW